MLEKLKTCPLFQGMTVQEIELCIKESGAVVVPYAREEIIFHQLDVPQYLHVLLSGTVSVCNETRAGKRNLVAVFSQSGELFGEVFVFLGKQSYDHYALADTAVKVLQLPKAYFLQTQGVQNKLVSNMMMILARKAYFLNRRLQVMSQGNLRQKIAMVLLQHASADGRVQLAMNRETLADYLNTARPSLSRELMRMQEDGLIRTNKKDISICDVDALHNIL